MTDDDRARAAQIVAWELSRNATPEQIERSLARLMSGAEADDIAQAMRSGWAAVLAADYINRASLGEAADVLQGMREDGARGWRVLYRVRTGAGPDDWAGGATKLGVEAGAGSAIAAAEADARAVLERSLGHDSGPIGGVPNVVNINVPEGAAGRVEIVYVAPL